MTDPSPPAPQTDVPVPEERDDAVIARAFRRSLAVFVGVLLLAGLGGLWWWTRPKTANTTERPPVELPNVRSAGAREIPRMLFTDVTESAGLRFVHENGARGDKLLPETMGAGCAFLDYDGDGDQDILLVNSSRWPGDPRGPSDATAALYRNDGRGKYEDVTAGSGLDVLLYGMGVACGDFDNDGRVDVFLSAVGSNRLFRNVGGKFEDVTEKAGVAGEADAWNTACGWFDMDRDGDLDLFVCRYVAWSRAFDLAQNFTLKGGVRAYGRPQDFEGTHPRLYRNDGDGTFTEVSKEAGVRVDNPLTGRPMAKALGLTFADVDRDGWPDVLIANDTVQNFLFRNKTDGTFEEIASGSGFAFDAAGNARGGMGIDASRFRNDRALGVTIGNFANETTALFVDRDGQAQFNDEAVSNGLGPITRLELTFGILFADLDLDGRPDLIAANGHLEDDIQIVQPSQHYAQPPHLMWNCGADQQDEFETVPAEKCGGDLLKPLVGRGLACADIDGDGDLDLLITACGGPPRLLRNDQNLGHRWLRVTLQGTKSNRDAIGAQVELTRTDGKTQHAQVMPTRGYLSQSELPVTFGLGKDGAVAKLRVTWPDGRATEHGVDEPIALDKPLVLTEPSGK